LTTKRMTGRRSRTSPAADPPGSPLTLADEHTLLLGQVARRAGDLLTELSRGRRPAARLQALVGYTQSDVLQQAAREERLLFPAGASRMAARLARDHARLRAAIDRLARVAAGEQPLPPDQLAVAIRDFVCQLERHLSAELAWLANGRAPRSVPATAILSGPGSP